MKFSILRWAGLCCITLVRKKKLQFVRKGTKLAGKKEMAEEVRNNQFHHSDTWLPPCGKPRWQMLRVRVKGKVLGNDMWNRGQTVQPPCIADVLHCAIVDRQHWAKQCEDTLFQSIWQSRISSRLLQSEGLYLKKAKYHHILESKSRKWCFETKLYLPFNLVFTAPKYFCNFYSHLQNKRIWVMTDVTAYAESPITASKEQIVLAKKRQFF